MRRCTAYLLFLALCLSVASCGGAKHAVQPVTAGSKPMKKKQRKQLADFACRQLNVPYKWGGNTPKGFDCSGFTTYCFAHFGMQLPRTAAEQVQVGKRVRSRKARTGDLIFFKGPDHKVKKTGHVGIVMSGRRQDIKFIHAGSKGIAMASLREEYFSKRFTTIRRVRR
jgi:cell wall-associated NlpC family hydrolase